VHWGGSFSARHLLYDPGALIAVAGFIVTLICVPLAIEVAQASEEDLAIPVFKPEADEAARPASHHAHPRMR
jgi:hypothetical protein